VKFQMCDYMVASQECVGTKWSYADVVWGTAGESSNVTQVANMTDAVCESTLTVNGLKGKGQQAMRGSYLSLLSANWNKQRNIAICTFVHYCSRSVVW
jgi:hypothetical protein